MSIYVVMASANNGVTWWYCLDANNCIMCYDMKSTAKVKMEATYERLREECRRLKVKHIPRKYFKIVEFVATEE